MSQIVQLVLDGIDYNVNWLSMGELENVAIQGTEGTRLISDSGEDEVLDIYSCKGIVLKNLVLGYDIPTEEGCTERVLSIYESEISIVNCIYLDAE